MMRAAVGSILLCVLARPGFGLLTVSRAATEQDPIAPSSSKVCPSGAPVGSSGYCECPQQHHCYMGSSAGCLKRSGSSNLKQFLVNCTTCHCSQMCPDGIPPDELGQCKCASGTYCYTGKERGCEDARHNRNFRLFPVKCENCRCTVECPAFASPRLPTGKDNCMCPKGTRCREGNGLCRKEEGSFSRYSFRRTCANCRCEEPKLLRTGDDVVVSKSMRSIAGVELRKGLKGKVMKMDAGDARAHVNFTNVDQVQIVPPYYVQFLEKLTEVNSREPVFSFYDETKSDSTLHFLAAKNGEITLDVMFYAYRSQVEGTEPVFSFWNAKNKYTTYHFDAPAEGEQIRDLEFYAYKELRNGTTAIHSFHNGKENYQTYHPMPAWKHEAAGKPVFYAYAPDESEPCVRGWMSHCRNTTTNPIALDCFNNFTYDGKASSGCLPKKYGQGSWCSVTPIYKGRWHNC